MENCFWAEDQYHCYNPAAVVPPPFEGSPEDRTASASRSHSEAEKRRRDRINAQLATLRKLIPMSEKMDKAVLLGHAVEQIKEQSKRAKEASKLSATIPTETDQLIIDHINTQQQETASTKASQDNQIVQMKVSICCDDRPQLLAEINAAIKGLALTIFQAEITSLGGRMKSSFVLCAKGGNLCATSLKQSLKLALSRVVLSYGVSSYSVRSKRQRFFYSH